MDKNNLLADVAIRSGASVNMNRPAFKSAFSNAAGHRRTSSAEHYGGLQAGRLTRGYPPIPPEVETGLLDYLSDNLALGSGRNSDRHSIGPERLVAGLPHGPFAEAELTTDPGTGSPCVAFKVRNEALQPRYVSHETFLFMRLLLCRGGGCAVNDNSKRYCEQPKRGYGYVTLFGGRDNIGLIRLELDTGRRELAKQHGPDGERGDYHCHDPRFMVKERFEVEEAKGRKSKVPFRGRQKAVETALKAFDRTKSRTKSPLTREAFEVALWQSFDLYDLVNGQA